MPITTYVAVVEAVRDGTTFRVRLLMPEGDHQFINIGLAGVRSPRAASKPGETSEQWGEEVGLAYLAIAPPSRLIYSFSLAPLGPLGHLRV